MVVKILRRSAVQGTQAARFDISRITGLIGIIAGLVALCGWSVLPAYVIRHVWLVSQVHPNAALGFILVGFSLRLTRFDRATPWVHTACKLFRISVGALGLLSLTNIWFHLNLGIDKFVVRDPTAVMPGAMPQAVALCFYVLGCALVLLTAGRSLPCQILGLTVTTIAVASLISSGYALLAPQVLPADLTMPAITALVLLILSLGVVNANAHHALMTVMTSDSVGGAMARRLLPASLAIPIVLGFLRLKGQDSGWFGPAVGLALHVVATMLLLAIFIWWNASALDKIARENRRFEHAVQDTQDALLEILRYVNNAAFAHDLQGNLTFFNAAAERLFGVSTADALRQKIQSVITPQSADTARSILSKGLIGGARRPESLVLRTSAGEQECAVLTTVMCDPHGNPVGFFSLVSPLVCPAPPEAPTKDHTTDSVAVA